MNQPPGSPNDRRHLPRHIRDGEHEMWHDPGDAVAGTAGNGRGRRVLLYVVLVVALVAGLWFFNGLR